MMDKDTRLATIRATCRECDASYMIVTLAPLIDLKDPSKISSEPFPCSSCGKQLDGTTATLNFHFDDVIYEDEV